MKILIRGAQLVYPGDKAAVVSDVLIEKGRIKDIAKAIDVKADEVIEAKGMHLFPGFIDLHTHFREPGFEAKETVQTGARAALKGGYVASVSMPNTNPPCDHQGVIDNIVRKAKEVPYTIFPSGTISKAREGKELSEMADMKQVGIVAVTDDGSWVEDSLLMRRAMEYASMLNLIVMSHCEDKRLSAGGVMNEGLTSTKLGLRGIPAASEEVAVARDIELLRLTGGHLHICHVSTARSVELIRRAKKEGLNLTTEVTPHNLTLTDEMAEGYNTNAKMYPPLRRAEDIKALRQALKEGVIDCVATDHAPHTDEEKMREFDDAPFGVIGLETAFGVIMKELHHGEGWPLSRIAEIMSARPREILGLDPSFAALQKDTEANFVLADVNLEWKVTVAEIRSKSRNSCFMNHKLKGKVIATFCVGKMWKF